MLHRKYWGLLSQPIHHTAVLSGRKQNILSIYKESKVSQLEPKEHLGKLGVIRKAFSTQRANLDDDKRNGCGVEWTGMKMSLLTERGNID